MLGRTFEVEEEPRGGLIHNSYKNIKNIVHFKNAKITEFTEQSLDHWLRFLEIWANFEALLKYKQ